MLGVAIKSTMLSVVMLNVEAPVCHLALELVPPESYICDQR
jgi:hypothetical protein